MAAAFVPPPAVRAAARLGLRLMRAGFRGGTPTGWRRARQLAGANRVPVADLRVMRAWFARHGPDAANGGTSHPGYRRWVRDGRPMRPAADGVAAEQRYRGAVAWLLWGGDAAYRDWLRRPAIRTALSGSPRRARYASPSSDASRTRRGAAAAILVVECRKRPRSVTDAADMAYERRAGSCS